MRPPSASALLLLSCAAAASQQPGAGFEEVGYLTVIRERAAWPSPESVLRDLQSSDSGVRLRAFHLLGLGDRQVYTYIYGSGEPDKPQDKVVVFPDQVRLYYAELGDDSVRQAVLALQTGQMVYAALAVPRRQGWEKIALFSCWCKYDLTDSLDQFVRIVNAPGVPARSEAGSIRQARALVLRGSGGGTGIYTQDEAYFRIYRGELRRVMSFVSRYRSCPPTGPKPQPCTIEYRWFFTKLSGDSLRAVLLTARGAYLPDKAPAAAERLHDVEDRYATALTCREYIWNAKEFRYEPVAKPASCEP